KRQQLANEFTEYHDYWHQGELLRLTNDTRNPELMFVQAANPDVVVTGGYLVYGQNTVQFVPMADVLDAYTKAQQAGLSPLLSNRQMSAAFLNAGEAHYNIQNILTYRPS
ncbi:hypothetical protein PHLCEN_2v13510, partial [Hermanssonia centrifuga]